MSSLATGWSWLAMAWAMLPGLMNLKRMSASGGWNRGSNWWFVASWVRVAIRPAVEAPPTVVPGFSGFSDQSADDLVEGLGLAGLVVESGAAADQGTAAFPEKGISTVIALRFYATA